MVDEGDTTAGWDETIVLCKTLGEIPCFLSDCCRALVRLANSEEEQRKTLELIAKNHVRLVTKVPYIRKALYQSALTVFEEGLANDMKIANESNLSPDNLLKVFRPNELAAVITSAFLARRIDSLMKEASQEALISMQCYADLSIYLGKAIPQLKLHYGILLGALRFTAFSLFQQNKSDEYKEYQEKICAEEKAYDLAQEISIWGVSHFDVGSYLLRECGLGSELANTFQSIANRREDDEPVIQREILAIEKWLDSFVLHGEPPQDMADAEDYELAEEEFEKLADRLQTLLEKGSKYSWLMGENG